jgi:hypothetical protein
VSRVPTFGFIDHPAASDERIAPSLEELEALYRSYATTRYDGKVTNSWGMLLGDPVLATLMFKMNKYISDEMSWTQDKRAFTLAVQLINKRRRCEYGFMALSTIGVEQYGVTPEEMAALEFYEESQLFDDEDRVTLEYTDAALAGEVSDALFARARDLFGDSGMLGFTVAVAHWSSWALILNVLKPDVAIGPFLSNLRSDAC